MRVDTQGRDVSTTCSARWSSRPLDQSARGGDEVFCGTAIGPWPRRIRSDCTHRSPRGASARRSRLALPGGGALRRVHWFGRHRDLRLRHVFDAAEGISTCRDMHRHRGRRPRCLGGSRSVAVTMVRTSMSWGVAAARWRAPRRSRVGSTVVVTVSGRSGSTDLASTDRYPGTRHRDRGVQRRGTDRAGRPRSDRVDAARRRHRSGPATTRQIRSRTRVRSDVR